MVISILYVDDEPALLELARLFLEKTGEFRVATSISAQEALACLRSQPPDAIISDYQMPGMDGIAFLRVVREQYGDLPFILFTGRGREEVVIEAINNGADFYVQKGGDPRAQFVDLAHKVRQVVRRRRAEVTLVEKEQRYHDLQNANDLIQSVAPDGHILFANTKWLETLGYTEEDLPNLTIFDIVHEEKLTYCMEIFQRVFSGESVGLIDTIFKTRDGKKVYVEGIADSKIVGGKNLYTRGLFKDTTDRKRAETALAEGTEIFQAVVEQSSEGIAITDPTGRLLYANHRAAEIVESRKDLDPTYGVNLLDFIAPEFRESAIDKFRRTALGEDRFGENCKIVTLAGREKWLECIGRGISLRGSPAVLLSFRDITERLQAEAELRDSEYKFATVFRSNPVPLTLVSAVDGLFVDINDAFLRDTGYAREEVIGRRFEELGLFADGDAYARLISKLRDEGSVQGMELSYRNRIGEIRPCRFSSSIVPIDGVPHILSSIDDITECKQAHDAIFKSGERYRLILENAYDGILINELTPGGPGKFIDINESARRIFGITREEIPGINLIDLNTPDMQRRAPGYVQDLMRDGHATFQTDYLTPENREKILDISVSLLDPGRQQTILSVVRDITEQKAAESALHALVSGMVGTTGRESLDRITESVSAWLLADCVVISEIMPDREHARVLSMLLDGKKISDHSCSLKGTPCENVIKEGFYIYPDNTAGFFPENRGLCDLGIRGYAGAALCSADGQVLGLLCILSRAPLNLPPSAREIIEIIAAKAAAEIGQMHALKALSESEKRLRTIFENSPHPITINSVPDNRFLDVNAAFLAATGYTREEILGRDPVEDLGMISPADVARLTSHRMLVGSIENVPLVFTASGGRKAHVLFSSMPITIDGGSAIVTMTLETTDLVQAEEELLRKNAELIAAERRLRENYEKLVVKERELRASEGQYRTLFENMHNGFIHCRMIYDTAGNPVDCIHLQANRAFSRMTGLEDVIGKKVTDLIPQVRSAHPELFEIYGRVARTRIPEVFEFYFRPLGRWLKVSAYSPEEGCFAAILEDFTARRQVEEALQKSEELLALVMNSIPTYLSDVDTDLRFVYINKPHASWYGLPGDMLVGKSLKDLLPEDVFTRASPFYDTALAGQEVTYENSALDRHGQSHVFTVHLVPHILEERVAGFFMALNDITERKRMEEALTESETRFHSMFEHHISIMLLVDPRTGGIIDVNLAAERFYGMTKNELSLLSIRDITSLPPIMVPKDATEVKDAFFITSHRAAGGEIRVVEVYSSPITLAGRTVFFSIINDITEKRRAEDALKQANKRLKLLSGITRHDINNQLQILNGYTALLRESNPDPLFENYLSHIVAASSQIESMIQLTREYEEVGVHLPVWQNLRMLVDDVSRSTNLGKITLTNDIPADMEVFADPLIGKVFYNLIDNILRHSGKATMIRFAHEARDGSRIIICEDDGDGVADGLKEKIFERGFGKNTGFGLPLSREILDITGITIKETGEAGRGARFEIVIPREQWRVNPT